MLSKDADIIELLKVMAGDNQNDIGPRLASCVVYKGKIVSFGLNKRKSHPFQLLYGKNKDSWFLHAEIEAIHKATKRLTAAEFTKSSLYVARVKFESSSSRTFINGLAKPCVGCARCIATFGFKRVVYTNEKSFDIIET